MAAPLEEYEKEAGCVPVLHPEVRAPRRERERERGGVGVMRAAAGRGGCSAAPHCRPGCEQRRWAGPGLSEMSWIREGDEEDAGVGGDEGGRSLPRLLLCRPSQKRSRPALV